MAGLLFSAFKFFFARWYYVQEEVFNDLAGADRGYVAWHDGDGA